VFFFNYLTFIQNHTETGKVRMTRRKEKKERRYPQNPEFPDWSPSD